LPYTHPYTAGMAHQGLNRKGQSMSYSLPVFNSFAEAVDFAKCNPSVTIVSYTAGDGCKTVVYRSDDSLTRLPNQEFSLPVFNSFAVAVNFAKCNPGFIIVRENAGYGWKAVGYQSDDSLTRPPIQEFSLPVFNSFAEAINFAKCNPGFIIVHESAGYGWKTIGYQSDDSLTRSSIQEFSFLIFNSFVEAADFAKSNPGVIIARESAGYGWKAVGYHSDDSLTRLSMQGVSLAVFNSFVEAADFAKSNPGVFIVPKSAGYGWKAVGYHSDDSLTRPPSQEFSLPVFNSFAEAVDFAKNNPGVIIVHESAGYGWKAVGYQSDDSLMRLSNWECLACEATEDVCGYEDAYEEIYCYEDNGEGVYDYENNDEDVYDYEDPEEGVCDYRDNDEDDGYDYNDQSLIWNDFMSDADDYAHSDRDGWFYSD